MVKTGWHRCCPLVCGEQLLGFSQPVAKQILMRNLRGTYVHRGDAIRRRRRIMLMLWAAGVVGSSCWALVNLLPNKYLCATCVVRTSIGAMDVRTTQVAH